MNIHFFELKQRLIYCVFFIFCVFLVFFFYSDIVYDLFSVPISKQLSSDSKLIATQVTSTFLVPLKLSINLSLLFSLPYVIFNVWSFIAPGLYSYEKMYIAPFIFLSIFLFFVGLAFSFYVICPLALNFFLACTPSNVAIMISINNYMTFMFSIMFATGCSFQVPIFIVCIIKSGIISKEKLSEKRHYVFICSFILGMLLTPPDVVSQVLLAIPIWLLFELGLFFAK